LRSQKELGDLSDLHTYQGLGKLENIGAELSGQFKEQWPGFGLVVIGLIGQLIGNFGTSPFN
jgi:hypothetical protein